MKKTVVYIFMLLTLILMLTVSCSLVPEENNAKTDSMPTLMLSFGDITLDAGNEAQLVSSFVIGEKSVQINYSFEGNCISIADGKVTALVANTETAVTATAEGMEEQTFIVKVKEEKTNGNINISFDNVFINNGEEMILPKSVKLNGAEKAVTYTFNGNNISISDYKLTALVYNTTTIVTASIDGCESSFKVSVIGDKGVMTIDAPSSIYTNYAPKPINVSFSNPEFASEVTFTASDERVAFKDGGIYATGAFNSATNVTVTAKSDYHSETFTVKVSEFSINNDEATVKFYEENIIKPENKGGTIFIGDSYFSGQLKNGKPSFWSDFYEDYAGEKAFLMGISSSQIVNWEIVSERIVYPMEPKEIVLHIGFNDVHSSTRSAYEIASRIIALLEEFREKLPNTKVYYCSVEPKKNALDSGSQFYEKSMIYAPLINSMIEAYTYENTNVKFVNTRQIFFNADGTINKNYYLSTDLSHPTLEAYDAYRQVVEAARGNAFLELTPTEALAGIVANQTSVNTAAAESKLNSTVYTIENNPREYTGQTLAKYFTDKDGKQLINYYSIKGYMEVSDLQDNGAHVQFRFSNTTNDRFLLYDSTADKILGICAPFIGKNNESSAGAVANVFDASSEPIVLSWQVIVTEKVAYFFVNDVLVFYGAPGALNYFNVSVEKADISFWGVEITLKSEDADAYNAILENKKII